MIDTTVNMGIRGVPELFSSQPWAAKPWARPEGGIGYSEEEADQLAADVVPAEVLEYAAAIRSQVSQWLKTVTDEELEAPNAMMDHARASGTYTRPEVEQAIAPLVADAAAPSTQACGCLTHVKSRVSVRAREGETAVESFKLSLRTATPSGSPNREWGEGAHDS